MAQGRGRLSSINLLPRECSPIVQWAAAELQETDRTQVDIYAEFVEKLEALQRESHGELQFDIPGIRSFNRYSMSLESMAREMREMREMTRALAGTFDLSDPDDTTRVAVELIKGAIVAMFRSQRGKMDAKSIQALSNGLKAILQAEEISQGTKEKRQEELNEKTKKAVETVAKAKGLTPETTQDILSMILGVEKAAA